MTIRFLSIESRTSNTLSFCALFIPAISLAIDMFFHQWSNRMCWYLRMSVNRRNDLQIFDFFRLLTIFFVIFTEIVEVAKGLYRWKA